MADEKIVQNECADFYPVTDLNNLIEQLYHHMDYDCLYNPDESNLFLTRVPIVTFTSDTTEEDINNLIREVSKGYTGEFVILQENYQLGRLNSSIYILPAQSMIDKEFSIFHNRLLPKNLPRPKILYYHAAITYTPEIMRKNYKNTKNSAWGDFKMTSEFLWYKKYSSMTISTGWSPGQEFFSLSKRFDGFEYKEE